MSDKLELNHKTLAELPKHLRIADFIDGSVERISKYVVRSLAEYSQAKTKSGDQVGAIMYNQRLRTLANNNITGAIVQGWLSNLAKQINLPRAATDNEQIADILEDVTNENDDFQQFSTEYLETHLGHGQAAALIDGPAEVAKDKRKARERGEKSHVTEIAPYNLLSIKRFKDLGPKRGKLSEVVIYEGTEGDYMSQGENMIVRRLWKDDQESNYKSQRLVLENRDIFREINGQTTKQDIFQKLKGGLAIKEAGPVLEGDLDEIPMVIWGRGCRDSVVRIIVDKNVELLNKKSQKDTINRNQAFRKLIGFGIKAEEIELWNEQVMAVVNDPQAKVQEISAGNPESLSEDIEELTREAYLDGFRQYKTRHQIATGHVQSAESKEKDNETFIHELEKLAKAGERALSEILRYIVWFETGREPDREDVAVSIGRDFSHTRTDNEIITEESVWSKADAFGDVGDEIKAEVFIKQVSEFQFIPIEGKTDQDQKNDYYQRIREMAKGGLPNRGTGLVRLQPLSITRQATEDTDEDDAE